MSVPRSVPAATGECACQRTRRMNAYVMHGLIFTQQNYPNRTVLVQDPLLWLVRSFPVANFPQLHFQRPDKHSRKSISSVTRWTNPFS